MNTPTKHVHFGRQPENTIQESTAGMSLAPNPACPSPGYEFIDSKTLAHRWCLPESWIREQVRKRSTDCLPHVKFGKYVRFRWGSPELENWACRRIISANNTSGRTPREERK